MLSAPARPPAQLRPRRSARARPPAQLRPRRSACARPPAQLHPRSTDAVGTSDTSTATSLALSKVHRCIPYYYPSPPLCALLRAGAPRSSARAGPPALVRPRSSALLQGRKRAVTALLQEALERRHRVRGAQPATRASGRQTLEPGVRLSLG